MLLEQVCINLGHPLYLYNQQNNPLMEYTPNEYERTCYYNGITGDGDYPELVYRSDSHTTPFLEPVGRFTHIPVKSLRGVFDTPLNGVWDTVGPEIRDLIKARKINWSITGI